ncbi:MAG TPA: formate dehydrogenase accessory sulfurtransferase FdhD [Thermomonas sp.]|nr:formate dehydrogenase accessory sulfurtransferase FdhD [Thermomonas sp.]
MNARIHDRAAVDGAALRTVQRRDARGAHGVRDEVACEVPVALHYDDSPFAVLMATPCDLADLAIGFSLSEGLIEAADELQIGGIDESLDGVAIRMSIPAERHAALASRSRNLPGYGGCGLCGSAGIDAVLRTPARVTVETTVEEAALHRAFAALHKQQPLNAATGATHAAGFADREGNLRLVREDVGRHNALDKLVGAMASQAIDAGSGFAIVTSRASYELAMKAAQVGIPLLAAISAPTTLAIALAESSNLCLVGFARDTHCTVYAHPQRLALAR